MKIKMTRTIQGSLDGVTVLELVEGIEYEAVDSPRGERLVKYHLRKGDAVPAPADVAAAPQAPIPITLARTPKAK